MAGFVQMLKKVLQAAQLQHLRQTCVGVGIGGLRIGQRLAQGADGQIGLLWQEELAAGRHGDIALPLPPEPGQGAQQGALAAARGAFDQQVLATGNAQIGGV